MINSGRADHIEAFNSLDWSKGHHCNDIRKVLALNINMLLKFYVRRPSIELAVLDVEGIEPEIISNWDFNRCRPKLFIIESRDRDKDFNKIIQKEYKDMLKPNGQKIILYTAA